MEIKSRNKICPRVSIIIVNFNGKKYLGECLSSVLEQDYPNYEIILVDNNSEDGSVEYVRKNFPSVRIIQNNKNYGYAKGCNIGIKSSTGEYIVILNPDTVVEKDWLSELVKIMIENPGIGACQSKILLYDKPDIINTDGNMMNYLGFGWAGNHGKIDTRNNKVKRAAYPSGCSMILKRKVIEEIGLFDEDLFMYHEDMDLGIRMRLQGYDILCNPRSIVYHKYSFKRNPNKFYYLERNRLIVILKFYRKRTLILLLIPLIFLEIGILIFALKEKWFHKKLDTYKYILRNLNRIKNKRNKIQASRKLNDAQLLEYMTGKIDFKEIYNPLLSKFVNPILALYFNWIKRFIWW